MAEIKMSTEDRIEYQDGAECHDWRVSVQTGSGQFYGDQFLDHVTAGLVNFAVDRGIALRSTGSQGKSSDETDEGNG